MAVHVAAKRGWIARTKEGEGEEREWKVLLCKRRDTRSTLILAQPGEEARPRTQNTRGEHEHTETS